MAVPSKYIQSVVKAAKGRPKSTDWYREKIKEFGTPTSLDLIRDGKQATNPFFGRLNMFIYDPKLKKKLPSGYNLFIISTSGGHSIIPAVTVEGPSTFNWIFLIPSKSILIFIRLTFNIISVRSSLTPGIDENS